MTNDVDARLAAPAGVAGAQHRRCRPVELKDNHEGD